MIAHGKVGDAGTANSPLRSVGCIISGERQAVETLPFWAAGVLESTSWTEGAMGSIHRFDGDEARFDWEGVSEQAYESPEVRGVTVRWLIGPVEDAPHFAVRFFEIEPGGCTSLDRHEHDHGVVVLRGRGEVLLGDDVTELGYGDVVYVLPNELHQFRCVGGEPFGFLCVIPNPRSVGQ